MCELFDCQVWERTTKLGVYCLTRCLPTSLQAWVKGAPTGSTYFEVVLYMAGNLVTVTAILNPFWALWFLALNTFTIVLIVQTISLTTYITIWHFEFLLTSFIGIVCRKFTDNLWRSLPQRLLQHVIIAYVWLLDNRTDFLTLLSLLSKKILQILLSPFLSAFDFLFQTQVLFCIPHAIWEIRDYLLPGFK